MPDQHVLRAIPVPLKPEERATLGEALAHLLTEREAVYGLKRAAVAEHNSKIKDLDKSVRNTTRAIETGSEMREVACVLRPGLTSGTTDVFIEATGELVETITDDPALSDEVAQQELPLRRPGKACVVCGNADGTHRNEPHGEGVDPDGQRVDLNFNQLRDVREALDSGLSPGSKSIGIEVDGEIVDIIGICADYAMEREEERDDGAAIIAQLTEEDLEPVGKSNGKKKRAKVAEHEAP